MSKFESNTTNRRGTTISLYGSQTSYSSPRQKVDVEEIATVLASVLAKSSIVKESGKTAPQQSMAELHKACEDFDEIAHDEHSGTIAFKKDGAATHTFALSEEAKTEWESHKEALLKCLSTMNQVVQEDRKSSQAPTIQRTNVVTSHLFAKISEDFNEPSSTLHEATPPKIPQVSSHSLSSAQLQDLREAKKSSENATRQASTSNIDANLAREHKIAGHD